MVDLGWDALLCLAVVGVCGLIAWPLIVRENRRDRARAAAEQRTLAQGSVATVTVEGFRRTEGPDDDLAVTFDLLVALPDREPVRDTYTTTVFVMDVPKLGLGARFPARVDPADLSVVFGYPQLAPDSDTGPLDGAVRFTRDTATR
jgi:hypothetical protein